MLIVVVPSLITKRVMVGVDVWRFVPYSDRVKPVTWVTVMLVEVELVSDHPAVLIIAEAKFAEIVLRLFRLLL